MDGYIGGIRLFAGNFAPLGWAFCHGQLLAISSNTALFSILGTTYGGDGRTTFGLPDCRGRMVVHPGNGPGLSSFNLGQKYGISEKTMTMNNMPAHSHLTVFNASNSEGEESTPEDQLLCKTESGMYKSTSNGTMGTNSVSVSSQGAGSPINNRQPLIALNYIICLTGIYPSRN